jgi:hypothetical protein
MFQTQTERPSNRTLLSLGGSRKRELNMKRFTKPVAILALAVAALLPIPAIAASTDNLWCQVKSVNDGMELATWAPNTLAGQREAAAACGYAISLGDFYGISSSTPATGRTRACDFRDDFRGVGISVWSMNAVASGSVNAATWCYDEAIQDNFRVIWPDGSVTPPGGP